MSFPQNRPRGASPHAKGTNTIAKCRRNSHTKFLSLFAKTINYLGHVILPGRLQIQEATTKMISKLQEATKQREVRSFLRLCNVFGRFVQNSLQLVAPPNTKLRKDQPYTSLELEQQGKQSVNELKKTLINAPLFGLLQATGHCTLDTVPRRPSPMHITIEATRLTRYSTRFLA